ncbi:hypothetical protein Tco_0708788 [Tanacetum coccineum]
MSRDIIQLENAVSTISQEYLLEFTSVYGIPEGLHSELSGLEETIVEFPEGKVGVYTKFFEFANFRIPISQFLFDILGHYQIHLSHLSVIGAAKVDEKIFPTVVDWHTNAPKDGMPAANSYSAADVIVLNTHHMDLFNLTSAPNPTNVKTETRPRVAHKDEVAYEILPTRNASSTTVALETGLKEEVAAMGPLVNKGRRKRGNNKEEANMPPKVLTKDHDAFRPAQSTRGGKSLASMGLDAGSILSTPAVQDPSTATKSVSDPELLSYAKPSSKEAATEIPTEKVATTEVNIQFSVGSPESGRSTSYNINLARQMAMGSQLRLRFEQEVRLLKKARSKIARRDQRIQVREEEIKKLDQEIQSLRAVESEVHSLQNRTKNLKTPLEAEVDMKKVAEAKNAELAKELDSLRVQFSDLQVSNNQLAEQVLNVQAQVTGEEKIKAVFEEFKKYEDDKVEQRCAEMNARLDKLKIRQAFVDVVSAGLAKEKEVQGGLPHPREWSAHHARSNGNPVSAPTVVPQGLAILLADAATQTEAADKEEEPHPRLQ